MPTSSRFFYIVDRGVQCAPAVGGDAHIVPFFISSAGATQRAPAVGDDAHIVPLFLYRRQGRAVRALRSDL